MLSYKRRLDTKIDCSKIFKKYVSTNSNYIFACNNNLYVQEIYNLYVQEMRLEKEENFSFIGL